MKQEKKYTITLWEEWNKTISDAIDDFFQSFLNYPIIIQANEHTFSQFDFLINIKPGERDRVTHIDEHTNKSMPIPEDEFIEITSFTCNNCNLDFSLLEELSDKEFLLVYDSEPDWEDGNDDIMSDFPKHLVSVK